MKGRGDAKAILAELRAAGNAANLEGMSRYGIQTDKALGVTLPKLRALAKTVGRDHEVALELWGTGVHEARILASLVDDPSKVTMAQMDRWVKDFDSWDVCDGCCSNLFDKTPYAWSKAAEWSRAEAEFVKRAGFVLMAALAVHDKKASDEEFVRFFPLIRAGASDSRNFVKKAVNWALRGIGKRNLRLNGRAIRLAEEIHRLDGGAARWVASDALRELKSPSVQERLRRGKNASVK
jgi:3-methyladenine DNA glycosylase AlkD